MSHPRWNRFFVAALFAVSAGIGSLTPAAITPAGDSTIGSTSGDTYVGRDTIGTLTIDGGSSLTNGRGYIGHAAGAQGSAFLLGNGSKWTCATLHTGHTGAGSLSIDSGASVATSTGYIGFHDGSTGTVSVVGAGSSFSSSGDFIVGRLGAGTLMVADGGRVTARTFHASLSNLFGNGTITTNGAVLDADLQFDATHSSTQSLPFGSGGMLELALTSTADLGVGHQASGTLQVADGVAITSRSAILGSQPGSIGTATITGTGSKWSTSINSDFFTGYSGSGKLRVEAGGEVSTRIAYLGYLPGSSGAATITGSGSKWTNRQQVNVGYSGAGMLVVEAGAQVSGSTSNVGYNSGATGSIVVTGTDSALNLEAELFLGYRGLGSLTVADGGSVTARGFHGAISNLHGNGTITVEGAVLDDDFGFDATHAPTQSIAFGSGGVLKLADTNWLGAGYQQTGRLHITDGAQVDSSFSYFGYHPGSSGTVTVSGAGTMWDSGNLRIGHYGTGMMEIADGAALEGSNSTWIAYQPGSTGTAIIRGAGTHWQAGTVHVGEGGSGTLMVSDQAEVTGAETYIAYLNGSKGVVIVSGANARLTGTHLVTGLRGDGELQIRDGARADNGGPGVIGDSTTAFGRVTVTGAGSLWRNGDGTLVVGNSGRATLTISDGGSVTADKLNVNNRSATRLHVSGDGMVGLGSSSSTGAVFNNGAINFYADALLPPGVYQPIIEAVGRSMTWSGSGSYNAVGGVWDNTAKTFSVSAVTSLPAGASDVVTSAERLLFSDAASGARVGVSFGAIPGTIDFSATPSTNDEMTALGALIGAGHLVYTAWDFTTNFSGGEVMLSFDVGTDIDDITFWRLQNDVWSAYSPELMTYDQQGLASILVTSFSGYAVSGLVPEPGTLALVGVGFSLAIHRRRHQQRS